MELFFGVLAMVRVLRRATAKDWTRPEGENELEADSWSTVA
jgi:hypothetical protein